MENTNLFQKILLFIPFLSNVLVDTVYCIAKFKTKKIFKAWKFLSTYIRN